MKIAAKNLPLNEEMAYRYLLDTDLFPIGFKGSAEHFLDRIKREHKRLGGTPCTYEMPLQLTKSCLKILRKKGFYKLRFRDSWERVHFTNDLNKDQSDRDDALIGAIIGAANASSMGS